MIEKDCIICHINNQTLPSKIIYEDDLFIAFLDINPLFLGHTLLASKKHYTTFYDLPREQGNDYVSAAQQLGRAVTIAMHAEGSFIAINNIVSQSIPHLHTHIIPRVKKDGLKGFFWPRTKYKDDAEMTAVQHEIIKALAKAC